MIKVNDDELIVKIGPVAVYSMNSSYKRLKSGKVVHTPGYCRVEVNGKKVASSVNSVLSLLGL